MAQVHPFETHVQPDGDRVHAALCHHVCHLPVCAWTAPAVLRKGNASHSFSVHLSVRPMIRVSVVVELFLLHIQIYGDMWAKLRRAVAIWSGFGMTLTGVHTCGDYMFSGHTVVLTLLNFFVTECKSLPA